MQNWHCYVYITLIFTLNMLLSSSSGCPLPLLLGATVALLVLPQSTWLLKMYSVLLVCCDYFLIFDQWGPPLMYLGPILLGAPALNQLLMPAARTLLPYVLFTLAYTAQKIALEPLVSGVLPTFGCTFLPFCSTLLCIYITLKLCLPVQLLRKST